MKTSIAGETTPPELILAIGLLWGHLNAAQFEQARKLVRGCLCLWPRDSRLVLMAAYADVELGEALDTATLAALRASEHREWADLVLRRAARAP
ncbi:hypothetical protein HSX11_09400 [Oxalobacteraceae bacterium]|nr:hypothetical protein [Oxalobacteraceae bacterium]